MGGVTLGKVLIVGGDGASVDALRPVLVAAGFDVTQAASGEEALVRAEAEQPAAVLVDLDDREASGYLACKLLRERYGDFLPIVFLSGERMEAADRVVGLLLGADDYVVKPFNTSELVARLRRLMARSGAHNTVTVSSSQEAAVNDFDLTGREQQVMGLLLSGLTQSEIARELVISPNTVATHIQRILLKLGVHNRAQAVAKVARAGWLQKTPLAGEGSAPSGDETPATAARGAATTPP